MMSFLYFPQILLILLFTFESISSGVILSLHSSRKCIGSDLHKWLMEINH